MAQQWWQWWNGLWSEDGGTWASVVAGSIAAGFAIKWAKRSWEASVEATRSGYRPVVRPQPSTVGPHKNWKLVLKNYGQGPAISAHLLDDAERIMDVIDLIEPLGAGETEASRVGRKKVMLDRYLEHGIVYRLLYQDLGGDWHETRFRYWWSPVPSELNPAITKRDPPSLREVRYLGRRPKRSIPEPVWNGASIIESV